jgi:hypothetical protein
MIELKYLVSYDIPEIVIQRIDEACERKVQYNKLLFNKSFIESGVIGVIYGLVLSIFETEGSWNKKQYMNNFYSLNLTQHLKRLLVFLTFSLLCFGPFFYIPYHYTILYWIF